MGCLVFLNYYFFLVFVYINVFEVDFLDVEEYVYFV